MPVCLVGMIKKLAGSVRLWLPHDSQLNACLAIPFPPHDHVHFMCRAYMQARRFSGFLCLVFTSLRMVALSNFLSDSLDL